LLAKILARKLFAAARKRNADNLHALWFDAPKPLDCQTGRRWPARGAWRYMVPGRFILLWQVAD
jgi:hypothetical protein